ncbi:hypothetical protein FisN_5Lh264 [Fistulifera solaris]|uniref:HSA domain-containing protein n=1 Tax=Fistulifera solaris TaxID=1519565 RepID=A0A1Z5JIK8_FISSO|nr:hypothetical protein FisN_5Lh264 [Fistulifera solaris]|eukprot:GAX13843.1 hypothetical protein FisN_5Lh264 [Fistulifera solaris]
MPVPRNKRKRVENPVDSTSAPSRRRRDSGTGAEPPTKSDVTRQDTTIDEGNDQVETSTDIKLPLHEEDTEKNAELDESENLPMASPSAEGASNKTRLRALLVHRKLLLKRLQTMKQAAQARLSDLPPTNQTSDEEVSSFRELLRHATTIARQQAKSETQQERSSVSLRRGSSVGKRMNAALSTLSSVDPGTAAQPIPTGDISSSAVDRPQSAAHKSLVVKRSVTPQPQQRPASAPTLVNNNKLQQQRGPPHKGHPRQQRSVPSISMNNATSQNIICGETAALREQKAAIQAKLNSLYERRGQTFPPTKRFHKGRDLKLELPPRRQTAWDVLLQEMRWMATDFREERNWKRATTRLLSSAVMKKETSAKEIPAKKKVEKDVRAPKTPRKDCSNVYDDAIDVETAKNIARQLSTMISEKIAALLHEPKLTKDAAEGTNLENATVETVHPIHDKNDMHEKISSLFESVQTTTWKEEQDFDEGQQYGLQMSEKQSATILRIESRWDKLNVGSVLHGSRCSGKTILVCSLLWRRRDLGPQLLLCPASRLIRWGHELRRFNGLRPFVLDKNVGIDTLGKNDVLLCNHMSLGRLSKSSRAKHFVSLIIDCRHAFGFGRLTTTQASFCPSSIISSDWWDAANGLVNIQQRCLIVENESNTGELPTYARCLPHKLTLEILAFRTMLLMGAPISTLSSERLGAKNLLSWARKHVKEGSTKPASLFKAVKDVLLSCVKPLLIDLLSAPQLDRSCLSNSGKEPWIIVPIQMTASQQKAYVHCCQESQFCLSQKLSDCRSISDSLLRLRRCCSFVENDAVSSTVTLYQAMNDFSKVKTSQYSNPSWLSFDAASRLLKASGKLQALLSILSEQSSVSMGNESSVELLLETKNTLDLPSSAIPKAKRIAVVAALPELLLMTSILLHCVGLSHRLLLEPTSMPDELVFDNWKENQLALCDFNSDTLLPEIVVCSIESISGDHGGLSTELADLFVCLDEDWSGRSEVLLQQVVNRSFQRRSRQGMAPCNFLRLISKNTCESTFLLDPHKLCSGRQHRIFSLKINPIGWFDTHVAPEESNKEGEDPRKRAVSSCLFGFPADNVLSFRDSLLSEILATDKLPPLLSHNGDVLFLPSSKQNNELELESSFIYSMIESEWLAKATTTARRTPIQTKETIQESFSVPALFDSEAAFFFWKTTKASLFSYIQQLAVISEAVTFGLSEGLTLAKPSSIAGSVNKDERISKGTQIKESFSDDMKPDASESSLLFYNFNDTRNEDRNEHRQRFNLYAASFGKVFSASDLSTLCQGEEPIFYTPPLFPRIVESSILAESDSEFIISSSVADAAIKISPNGDHRDAKRLRLDHEFEHSEDVLFDIALDLEDIKKDDSYSQSLAVPSLVEDFGMAGAGAVPLPRDSALAAAHTAVVPMKLSYYKEATDCFIGNDVFEAEKESPSFVDESTLKSVILFVSRKRPRGQVVRPVTSQPGKAYRVPLPGSLGPPSILAAGKSVNGVIHEHNGSLTGKQMKKRKAMGSSDHTMTVSSAFTRLPYNDTALLGGTSGQMGGQASVKTKDSLKKNLLISLRQSSSGLTLFESTGFRLASTDVKNRVGSRLMSHSWTSNSALEVGPGLPLHVVRPDRDRHPISFEIDKSLWTSIIKKLGSSNDETGNESLEVATKQKESFHQSLSIPCRMNFGPFQAGFLASPTGMTYISATKNRVGISLPMGVKVSSNFDSSINNVDWTPSHDEHLIRAVQKFGFHWNMVAKSQACFNEFRYVYDSQSASRGISRNCRERWQALSKLDPLLNANGNQRHKYFRHKIDLPAGADAGQYIERPSFAACKQKDQAIVIFVPGSALLGKQLDDAENSARKDTVELDQAKATIPKRTFKAFNKSKPLAMKQKVPIPGVATEKPSIGPSHPSHAQSVEEAVTALGASGRSEMWPLQLLVANAKRTPSGDNNKTTSNVSANSRTNTQAPAGQPKTGA